MVNEEIILRHMGHAVKIAYEYERRRPVPDFDEARSVALFALMRATERYTGDPQDGANFWCFARPAVAGAMLDQTRNRFGRQQQRRYVPISGRLSVPSHHSSVATILTVRKVLRRMTSGQREAVLAKLAGEPYDYGQMYFAIRRAREVLKCA